VRIAGECERNPQYSSAYGPSSRGSRRARPATNASPRRSIFPGRARRIKPRASSPGLTGSCAAPASARFAGHPVSSRRARPEVNPCSTPQARSNDRDDRLRRQLLEINRIVPLDHPRCRGRGLPQRMGSGCRATLLYSAALIHPAQKCRLVVRKIVHRAHAEITFVATHVFRLSPCAGNWAGQTSAT
jgi:hypothetical protein